MRDLYHRNRNTGFQTGWSSALNWKIDMLNHLLILMDSIQLGDGIVIFFTTNFPKKLDGAFRRSGRLLDLILTVTHPEKEERMQLFKLFLKNKTYDKKILPPLMPLSTGMTGADIRKWVDKAHVQAIIRTNATQATAIPETERTKSFFHRLLDGGSSSVRKIEIVYGDFEDTLHLIQQGVNTKELSAEAKKNHAKHASAHVLLSHLLHLNPSYVNLFETNLVEADSPQTIHDVKKLIQVAMAPFSEQCACSDILGHGLDLEKARELDRDLLLKEAYSGKFNMMAHSMEEEINRILIVAKQENDSLMQSLTERNPTLYEHVWRTLLEYEQLYRRPPTCLGRKEAQSTHSRSNHQNLHVTNKEDCSSLSKRTSTNKKTYSRHVKWYQSVFQIWCR